MFTGSDVVALRQKTGAGILDCKKALTETDGDMDKAVDYLREKGIATAAKKAGRIAAEGVCYAEVKGNTAVLVEVNCESDFVSKGEMFLAFVKEVAAYIFENDVKDVEEVIEAMKGKTTEAIQKIGENIKIRRYEKYVSDQAISTYIHMGGKIGVLLEVNCETDFVAKTDDFKQLVHDIAMHIAASNPTYITKEEVDQAEIEHEKKILREQAMNEPKPKPAAIIEKMVEGRIEKYYKEVCLLEQPFVKDPDKTVGEMVSAAIAKIGEKISVRRFVRYEMGEGLTKRQDNFAEEVMGQMKK